jgi:hypothetical protein
MGFSTSTKSVKFHASIPQPESYGLLKVSKVEFALGLGPCGRHVTELHHKIEGDLLTITQYSRLPDELEPPDSSAAVSARYKLHADDALLRDAKRWELNRSIYYDVAPERRIKYFRWGFWPVFEEVIESPKTVVIDGALSFDERAELEKAISDHEAAMRVFWRGLETKKFVYKIADIHGRIEVVTS